MSLLKIKDKNGVVTEIPIIQGQKGDAFTYNDFTPEQLSAPKGKSAYEYAQDGGYKGTENEFSDKLAKECSEFVITFDFSNEIELDGGFIVYGVDVSADEIKKAIEDKRTIICNYSDTRLPLVLLDNYDERIISLMFMFSTAGAIIQVSVLIVNDIVYAVDEIPSINIHIGSQYWNGSEEVDFTDTINEMIDYKLGVIENGTY
jgi:hypothetical protein